MALEFLTKLFGSKNERELDRIQAIVLSMTPEERTKPQIINGKRRKRIADGSGTSVQQVNKLIKQFSEMKKMMKRMAGKGGKESEKDRQKGRA